MLPSSRGRLPQLPPSSPLSTGRESGQFGALVHTNSSPRPGQSSPALRRGGSHVSGGGDEDDEDEGMMDGAALSERRQQLVAASLFKSQAAAAAASPAVQDFLLFEQSILAQQQAPGRAPLLDEERHRQQFLPPRPTDTSVTWRLKERMKVKRRKKEGEERQ